jgi:hypothetical protein
MPRSLQFGRWALTPPFHLFLPLRVGSIVSVALSMDGFPSPGDYPVHWFPGVRTFLTSEF